MRSCTRRRAAGIRIALDDFWTGYSSLSYLRNYPFDKIKIDRSFVHDLGVREDSLAIVRTAAGLAKALGMTPVAEGVETQEQLEQLRALGCTEAQGYLFSPPRPYDEIARLGGGSGCVTAADPRTSRGVTSTVSMRSRRRSPSTSKRPIASPVSRRCKSSMPPIAIPSSVTIASPDFTPPRAAGESGSTDSTLHGGLRRQAEMPDDASRQRHRLNADAEPAATHATFPDQRDRDLFQVVDAAIAKQMPCAGRMTAVFTPMTEPSLATRAPELRSSGLSAASVCSTLSSSRPVCARIERPSALTMPAVTVC